MKQLADRIDELAKKEWISRRNIVIDEDWVWWWVVDNLPWVVWFVNNSSPLSKGWEKTNYANLKSQCYFELARLVKDKQILVQDRNYEIPIIEELEQIFQKDVDKDWKLSIIGKDKIKESLGRSPDFSDALAERMYFELKSPKVKFYFASIW